MPILWLHLLRKSTFWFSYLSSLWFPLSILKLHHASCRKVPLSLSKVHTQFSNIHQHLTHMHISHLNSSTSFSTSQASSLSPSSSASFFSVVVLSVEQLVPMQSLVLSVGYYGWEAVLFLHWRCSREDEEKLILNQTWLWRRLATQFKSLCDERR